MNIKTMTYKERYELMKSGLLDLPKPEHDALEKKCQDNGWLKKGGYDFEDDPFLELDSPYSFVRAKDLNTLEMYFMNSNWSIRQGIVFKNLAFINQVNGGDEWWTLKYDEENRKWVAFESITMHSFIEKNTFRNLMRRLLEAPIELCLALNY